MCYVDGKNNIITFFIADKWIKTKKRPSSHVEYTHHPIISQSWDGAYILHGYKIKYLLWKIKTSNLVTIDTGPPKPH